MCVERSSRIMASETLDRMPEKSLSERDMGPAD